MFPTFMFGMIAHGGGRWFNFNFPFAAIPLAIPLLIYFTMIFMRVYAMCKNSFKVTNVSISSSKNFMHITLKVPKGYTWKSGQFAFINVPSVRKFEWHPFSIASSPNGKYLSFMIKRAGDWTGELIDKFYQTKKESFCIDKNLSNSERLKATISGICSEKYQDELRDFIMQMNLGNHDDVSNKEEFSNTNFLDLPISSKYPTINISKPISAPAEMAVKRKKII